MREITKRNAFDIAARSLLMGASVVITAVLVSIGVFQLNRAKSLAGAVEGRMGQIEASVLESGVTAYDGRTVTGSDVVNFCSRHLGDVSGEADAPFKVRISTKTVEGGEITGFSSEFAKSLKKSGGACYIQPTLRFECSVTRNANGIITEVSFIEKKG